MSDNEQASSKVEEFDSLSQDIHLLGDTLGRVIRQQAGIEIFDLVERTRALAKTYRSDGDPEIAHYLRRLVARLSLEEAEHLARAFTTYFGLINLAEENHRIRVLHRRERQAHPQPPAESITAAVSQLAADGVTQEEMARLVKRLRIELVFTAHPTEAKRRSVLSKLRRVADHLVALDRNDQPPSEKQALEEALLAETTALWLTERSRTKKPEVTDEVRTGLHYFETSIWPVIPRIYKEMRQALERYFPSVGVPDDFLSFASWIGGDRDGNPNVTPQVTAESLRLHRGLAVEHHRGVAGRIGRFLSLSSRLAPPSEALAQTLDRAESSSHVAWLRARYPLEPYRAHVALLASDLAAASKDDVVARLTNKPVDAPPYLRSRTQLLTFLETIEESLKEGGIEVLAENSIRPFIDQASVFGLHTAKLDIRQFSAVHTAALAELLRTLDIHPAYEELTSPERVTLLSKLFDRPPPDLEHVEDLSEETKQTLALFQMINRATGIYGPDLVGPYIVSMTRGPEDVLLVLLLAHWHGLCLAKGSERLAVAPLFETREDLENASATMRTLFKNPAYTKHLKAIGGEQTIMIGYSDSNKDAGYLAANWELFQAQEKLADVCRQYNVILTLFHGRGGTVARGGGPIGRVILAQPPNTVDGRLRVTEQGEIIDERYGNPAIAYRHLGQVIQAVLLASSKTHSDRNSPKQRWRQVMSEMSAVAHRAYRAFVYESPDLLAYWQQATPIKEISLLRIGSRPSRRQSADPFASLRAIPWVFSWMQSRHGLPGWYGLGAALETQVGDEKGLAQLREMYRDWPFFRALIDNAQMALGKADMGIAGLYASLVEDVALRKRVFGHILNAYQSTCRLVLEVTTQKEILDNAQTLKRSVTRRNPYVDPLNFIQVSLLRQLRSLPNQDSDEARNLLEVIFLTINGIASGLKNTG